MISLGEIRNRAIKFQKEWQGATQERSEAHTFWNEFFQIFDISRRRVATFEEPIKKLGGSQGFIDLFSPFVPGTFLFWVIFFKNRVDSISHFSCECTNVLSMCWFSIKSTRYFKYKVLILIIFFARRIGKNPYDFTRKFFWSVESSE